MTIQEFREYMASGKPVIGGSDVHMMFHQLSQEALRITAEINGCYHTPEELHQLLEQLWGREVPKSVGLFPMRNHHRRGSPQKCKNRFAKS